MMTLKPALGVNIKDYDVKKLLGNKSWRISEKIDGVRRLFYKSPSNQITAYSRTGLVDKWLEHITEWLEQPYYPNNMIYDCELVDRESYFKHVDSFLMRAESVGKASQQYAENKVDLMAICFDMFRPGGDMSTGEQRTRLLDSTFVGVPLSEPIIQVPIYGYIRGARSDILDSLMLMITANKGEGLMLMNMESPYIPGRSNDLVKVKRLQEFIGTITGIIMAGDETKISGGVAALICDVEGCTVPIRVGTGFTHELRQELAIGDYLGVKIEIEAFGRTQDRKGNISLSMPVFKQFLGV